MSKPRSDSLYARLKTKGLTESQATLRRKELFDRMDGGEALTSIVKQCTAWGVKTSVGAVSEFYSWHLLDLQMELAQRSAAPTQDAGAFEKQTSLALAQKRYVTVMKANLEDKVLVALSYHQVELEKLKIQSRRMTLLEEKNLAAKKALDGIKQKGGLTKEQLEEIESARAML